MKNILVEEYKKINPQPPYPNEYHGPHEYEWDDWWRAYSMWVESQLLEAREKIKRMEHVKPIIVTGEVGRIIDVLKRLPLSGFGNDSLE